MWVFHMLKRKNWNLHKFIFYYYYLFYNFYLEILPYYHYHTYMLFTSNVHIITCMLDGRYISYARIHIVNYIFTYLLHICKPALILQHTCIQLHINIHFFNTQNTCNFLTNENSCD